MPAPADTTPASPDSSGFLPAPAPLTPGGAPAPALPKLYTPRHVALATFIGSPIAGGFVIASSLRKLGRAAEGRKVIVLSLLLTVGWIAFATMLPFVKHLSILGEIVGVGIMTPWAKRLLDSAEREHLAAGGKLKSAWAAAGIGVLALAGMAVVLLGAMFLGPSPLRASLTDCAIVGPSEVCFDDGADAGDARKVLDSLVAQGLTPGQGMDVKVTRSALGPAVWFMVQDGAWDTDKVISAFTAVGKRLHADAFPQTPLEVRLADGIWTSHRTIPVE